MLPAGRRHRPLRHDAAGQDPPAPPGEHRQAPRPGPGGGASPARARASGALATIRALEKSAGAHGQIPHHRPRRCVSSAASPSATWPPSAVTWPAATPRPTCLPCWSVLDALIHIVGPRGERVIPVEEFFLGPGRDRARARRDPDRGGAPRATSPAPARAYQKQCMRGVDLATRGGGRARGDWSQDPDLHARPGSPIAGAAPVPLRCREAESGAARPPCSRGRCDRGGGRDGRREARPREDSLRADPVYRRRLLRAPHRARW